MTCTMHNACCLATLRSLPAVVLDPFAGSGTTGQVALETGRACVLIEVGPQNVALIKTRLSNLTPSLPIA